MSDKKKERPRTSYAASNSFDYKELQAMIAVYETALRGGDISILLRSPHFQSTYAKVKRMFERLDRSVTEDTLKALAPRRVG